MKQLSRIIDSQVIDREGNRIGVIDELILSSRTGHITRVIVKREDRSRYTFAWRDFAITETCFVLKRSIRQ